MVETPPRRKLKANPSYTVYKPAWDDGRAPPKFASQPPPPAPPKPWEQFHNSLPQNGLPKPKGLKGEAMFPDKGPKKAQANGKQAPAVGPGKKKFPGKKTSPKKAQPSPPGLRPNGAPKQPNGAKQASSAPKQGTASTSTDKSFA